MKQLSDLYIAFFRVGALTFGGGMAMLPMLKREVVEARHWTDEEELLDIFAIGQCTPGVIAVNTATYIGYKQAGLSGAVAATLGLITPSLIIIILIASILREFIMYPIVQHALTGIRVIVCALMFDAVVRMAKTGIKDKIGIFIFLSVFLTATFTPVPTILLIVLAGTAGVLVKKAKTAKEKKSA